MKNCQECKQVAPGACLSPKVRAFIKEATGLDKPEVGIYLARFEICKGEWFEPRAVDPGEGFRLLSADEISIGRVCDGDGWYSLVDRQWYPFSCSVGNNFDHAVGHLIRRRIEPQIEKCPEGHEATCNQVCNGFFVACNNPRFGMSWTTTICDTRQEAIVAWNEVMAAYHKSKSQETFKGGM